MNEKIIDLNELFSKMDLDNSEFLNFFDLRHLQAGILRLKPGERDTQEPHSSDEIYLVLEGCLLYTSPSPRDRQKSRMPSSA